MLSDVVILGLLEGLTEFLPVSSTGHLILAGHFMHREGAFWSTFEIVIQVGAILAVLIEYRQPLVALVAAPARDSSRRLWGNLVVGVLPALVLGALFHHAIKARLFGPKPVAIALIVGAIAMLVVERTRRTESTKALDAVRLPQAFAIGLAQCAALVPGFSRAAAAILGGLLVGLDRPTAAQYSFLLGVPTLLAAAAKDLFDARHGLGRGDLAWMGLGLAVSFVAAWAAVRWFVRYVSRHSLDVFAWYRLALGAAMLLLLRVSG